MRSGVRKKDWPQLFDLWLPELAPSASLLTRVTKAARQGLDITRFAALYERELARSPARRLLRLVALMARRIPVSVGCYCEDEDQCHRPILKRAIERRAREL